MRAGQSLWQRLDPAVEAKMIARLAADLESGRWDVEHGALRALDSYAGSLRLVISEAA